MRYKGIQIDADRTSELFMFTSFGSSFYKMNQAVYSTVDQIVDLIGTEHVNKEEPLALSKDSPINSIEIIDEDNIVGYHVVIIREDHPGFNLSMFSDKVYHHTYTALYDKLSHPRNRNKLDSAANMIMVEAKARQIKL